MHTIYSSEDSAHLLLEARQDGLEHWPGDRITYQGQPGTVRLVVVESRLEVRPGDQPGVYAVQKRLDVFYYLTLDNGACPAEIPPGMVQAVPKEPHHWKPGG